MAVRIGQTRNTSRLLKTVGGKPHATEDDHEEEDVNRDPDSSDDETHKEKLREPTKKRKTTQHVGSDNEDDLRKPPPSNPKRKAEQTLPAAMPDSVLNVPGLKKKTRATAPRVPKLGQFEQSRIAKEGLKAGKENSIHVNIPPSSSRENPFGFNELAYGSSRGFQKANKKTFGSKARAGQATSNIHAARPPTKKATHAVQKKAQDTPPKDDDENSDNVSMLSEPLNDEQLENLGALADLSKSEPDDPELRNVPLKRKKVFPANEEATESCTMNDTELDALLKPTLREQLGLTDISVSSLPPSSAPQEDMDKIDTYVRALPIGRSEDTSCAICHTPVSSETYWTFWKGLPRTVKNQASFCHSHRRATAAAEFASEGYPRIDWPRLADRIKKHRMALYSILADETPSPYRTRYAPLARTGKAASLAKTRSDLPAQKQEELSSSALDDAAVYPGYYGPRGRRQITECVMSLLAMEIKRSTDPVVQISGPASFVQAVLVPEAAVRLIMEDVVCDREQAEEVRERTFEMGCLLNEEIEDEVVVGEEDEEQGEAENEYHL